MELIEVLAALATILAAGFGALTLILGEPKCLSFAEQLALSWLGGTGIVSLSIWLLGFVLSGPALFSVVSFICVALPLVAWKTKGAFRFQELRRANRIELGLACILAVEILAVGYLAFTHTLGWDGLLNWEIKARYAFANGGVMPAAYLQDAGRAFSHPEYPLAIPFTELWLYFWLGEASQFWAKVIFPIYCASGAVLLVAISARLTGKLWTAFVAGIVLFFVPQITVEVGSAIVGYADFPLSVFYLAVIGYLLCANRNSDNGDFFRIYAVCLAFLPWVKREGVISWLIAAICGVFVIWRSKRSPKYLCALLPGLCIVLAWRVYLSQMHAVSSSDFMEMNLANLRANIHRLGPILSCFASEVTDIKVWGLFWLMAGLAGVYFVRRHGNAGAIVLIWSIVAPLAAYASIFVFSAWPDFHRHAGLSIGRLLMHITPLACLTLPAALASLPSLQEVFYQSRSKSAVATTTCEEEIPGRTPGIDFA
jgi:hypothetical protein